MKTKCSFLALILFFALLSCIRKPTGPDEAEGVWACVRQSDGGMYWDMTFTDSQNGWIVGNQGRIFHTEDGGETWEEQTSGTENHLRCVSFIDAQTGWAAGNYLTVVRTEDGGKNWQLVYVNPNLDHLIMSFFFYNEHVGVMATNHGEIYQSLDGGETWSLKEKYELEIGNTAGFHTDGLAVINFVHRGFFYVSKNRGDTWSIIQSPPEIEWATGIQFITKKIGWLCNHGMSSSLRTDDPSIFKTVDSGKTWRKISQMSAGPLSSIFFTSNATGWLECSNKIYYSSNCGYDWTLQDVSLDTVETIQKLTFSDPAHGWALGRHGEVLKYQ